MYVHTTQSPQDYELMISRGLSTNPAELTQVGPFYLRETDKKLTGKIQYSINNGEIRTATFSMHDAGDFSRNHFTQADKRTLNEIPLHSRKAKVWSKHPKESYEIVDNNGQKVLRILNATKFWELSNYLVIQVD